jgi:hypothetical protein
MRSSVDCHFDKPMNVRAHLYGNDVSKGDGWIEFSGGGGGQLTIHSLTPEEMIDLGSRIATLGCELRNRLAADEREAAVGLCAQVMAEALIEPANNEAY